MARAKRGKGGARPPHVKVYHEGQHGGDLMSDRVLRLEYEHVEDGKRYYHNFARGVHLEAMPDGSLLLWHPSRRLYGDY